MICTHAHTYGNVVTLGLEGQARVRNYERVDPRLDFETDQPFQVRKTIEQVLTAGRCCRRERNPIFLRENTQQSLHLYGHK